MQLILKRYTLHMYRGITPRQLETTTMHSIYRTVQQDIADARAALNAGTESMRAYCAHCDGNGDWGDASADYMTTVIQSWIADMESAL